MSVVLKPDEPKTRKQIYLSAYVTMVFIVINLVFYALTVAFPYFFYDTFKLHAVSEIDGSKWYQLITATVMHADERHLLNNMLILGAAGPLVENYMGHVLYFFMYVLAGIAGNVLTLVYQFISGDEFGSLGASGCTLGVTGFMLTWLIINRKQLFESAGMKRNVLVFALIVIYECTVQAGANTVAHLGGCLMGVLFGLFNIVVFHNSKDMEGLDL